MCNECTLNECRIIYPCIRMFTSENYQKVIVKSYLQNAGFVHECVPLNDLATLRIMGQTDTYFTHTGGEYITLTSVSHFT